MANKNISQPSKTNVVMDGCTVITEGYQVMQNGYMAAPAFIKPPVPTSGSSVMRPVAPSTVSSANTKTRKQILPKRSFLKK